MSKRNARRGTAMIVTVLAMPLALGVAALAIDVGRIAIAAQRAQDVVDAAVLAGAGSLFDPSAAINTALQIVASNNETRPSTTITCSTAAGDIVYYPPGSTVPGFGPIGAGTRGLRVTGRVQVPYIFGRVFGFDVANVARSATALQMPARGVPFAPMWIDYVTSYRYGDRQQLKMASGPNTGIPGNFGWLCPVSGSTNFDVLLRGYNVPPAIAEQEYRNVGDLVYGLTGQTGGQAKRAISGGGGSGGLARLERALWVPYNTDTFESFRADNPRIMIVPMAEYIGLTGSNATYRIRAFAAFWIESANFDGSNSSMWGRFIRYSYPGVGGDPLQPASPVYTIRLVG